MVEAHEGKNTGRARAAQLLTHRLAGMSLDDRAEKLASFVPKSVLYDEALSATKVELVKDEETDLVSSLRFALSRIITMAATAASHQVEFTCFCLALVRTWSRK